METILDALRDAGRLMAAFDPKLVEIVALSLKVSLIAVVLATALALPLGAAIAVSRFRGRQTVIVLLNALMGLPPVVVGLLVYLLLSRAGPLGAMGLLITPYTFRASAVTGFPDVRAEMAHYLQVLGVDGVITDNPDQMPPPQPQR